MTLPLVAPPLHKRQQVARHVRALAASLSPGDRLPSVSDLERHLGVARKTIVSALEMLQAEGVIDARPRSGTFVAQRTGAGHAVASASHQAQSNTLAVFAYRPTAYYLSWINHLVIRAGVMGLNVECQYTVGELAEERIANCLAAAPLGAIVLSAAHPILVQQIQEAGRRAVLISEPRIGAIPQAPYVCSDAEQGGYLAAQHLLALGHKRIAYAHWMPSDQDLFTRRRWHGHARALQEAGLPEPFLIMGADRLSAWRDYPEVLRHDMMQAEAPTAFVAWSDIEAAVLVAALNRAGLHVPRDVSVIGYDNLPESVESEPRLTTVDQEMTTLTHRALSLLLDPRAYEEARAAQAALAATDAIFPACLPRLVYRESTAPPGAS